MKVLYFTNALTHYYNAVLNRIAKQDNVELVVVVPAGTSRHVGAGVYQTRTGIQFRVLELKEVRRLGLYTFPKGVLRVLLQERPDVIVLQEYLLLPFMLNAFLRLATWSMGIKVILKSIPFRLMRFQEARDTLHTETPGAQSSSIPARVARTLRLTRVLKQIRLTLRKWAFQQLDAHVVYIEEGIGIYGSYGVPSERIFVIHNSPDTELLRDIEVAARGASPIMPANPYRVIHVGRLVEWKRVDLLLKALAILKPEFPRVELLVAGYGPEEEKLKELAQNLDIEASVHFLGGVYDLELLARYLMASSAYVLAGMGGLSINDAMFFRLPIICSVCDGTEKKLVRDGMNGKYFAEGNDKDLAAQIKYIFDDEQRARQMGEASRSIIDNEINIHTVIKGYLDAFAYVLGPDRFRHPEQDNAMRTG